MFDDQTSAAAAPPKNLPIEPEDMFAGVEAAPAATPPPAPLSSAAGSKDALSAGVLKRKTSEMAIPTMPPLSKQPSAPPPMVDTRAAGAGEMPITFATKGPVLGKVLMFLFGGLILLGAIVGGWWVYNKFFGKTPIPTPPPAAPVVTTPPTTVPATTPPVSLPTPTPVPAPTATVPADIKNDNILFGQSIDTDKDGLDDAREREIGTDPAKKDTDGDGLTDGDEVIIWKTDPLKADTDGDGYADGKEVYNGYNPLGPGKLPALPPGVSTTTHTGTPSPHTP